MSKMFASPQQLQLHFTLGLRPFARLTPHILPIQCVLAPVSMSPSISVRDSIRFLPQPADEPTRTVVLTSPENRFVDIRILRPPPDTKDLDICSEGTPTINLEPLAL